MCFVHFCVKSAGLVVSRLILKMLKSEKVERAHIASGVDFRGPIPTALGHAYRTT